MVLYPVVVFICVLVIVWVYIPVLSVWMVGKVSVKGYWLFDIRCLLYYYYIHTYIYIYYIISIYYTLLSSSVFHSNPIFFRSILSFPHLPSSPIFLCPTLLPSLLPFHLSSSNSSSVSFYTCRCLHILIYILEVYWCWI